jgi:hypothetical protein
MSETLISAKFVSAFHTQTIATCFTYCCIVFLGLSILETEPSTPIQMAMLLCMYVCFYVHVLMYVHAI